MFGPSRHPSLLSRLTATLGIALVVLLNLLAVWPEAHQYFHQAEHVAAEHSTSDHSPVGDDDDGCVVVLFAHGHVLAALILFALLLIGLVRIGTILPERALTLAAVDYRLPQGCGPPLD